MAYCVTIAWEKLRRTCFSSLLDSVITLAIVAVTLWVATKFVSWGIVHAAGFWAGAQDCREVAGACWAVFGVNARLFLFGTYPFGDHARAAMALLVIILALLLLVNPRLRRPIPALVIYVFSLAAAGILLMGNEAFGLATVDIDVVGGFALTMFIGWLALPIAFPIALLLALARQGALPALRAAATIYIEVVRSIPLVVVLFLSATVVPLMLPGELVVAKVFRAAICITLFASAFLAEVIRGGLQSLSAGQYQAASALGLRYWQTQFLIVLPQIYPIIVRPACGIYIILFKNTSLISVIGLFELTGISSIITSKPEWAPFSTEIYVGVGVVYMAFCYTISSLASSMERQFYRPSR